MYRCVQYTDPAVGSQQFHDMGFPRDARVDTHVVVAIVIDPEIKQKSSLISPTKKSYLDLHFKLSSVAPLPDVIRHTRKIVGEHLSPPSLLPRQEVFMKPESAGLAEQQVVLARRQGDPVSKVDVVDQDNNLFGPQVVPHDPSGGVRHDLEEAVAELEARAGDGEVDRLVVRRQGDGVDDPVLLSLHEHVGGEKGGVLDPLQLGGVHDPALLHLPVQVHHVQPEHSVADQELACLGEGEAKGAATLVLLVLL